MIQNQAAGPPSKQKGTRKCCTKWKVFYENGARKLLTTEKKGLFLDLDNLWGGGRERHGFLTVQIASGDHIIGFDQKIPDWLIKIVLLGEAETPIRPDIKSRFSILGVSTSDAILGLWF